MFPNQIPTFRSIHRRAVSTMALRAIHLHESKLPGVITSTIFVTRYDINRIVNLIQSPVESRTSTTVVDTSMSNVPGD